MIVNLGIKNPDSRVDRASIRKSLEKFRANMGLRTLRRGVLNGGQTGAEKMILYTDRGKFFMKAGEKVDMEIGRYRDLVVQESPLFLEPDFASRDVLILPFFEGRTLTDILFDRKIGSRHKLHLINRIINTVSEELWLPNLKNATKFPVELDVGEYVRSHSLPGKNTNVILDDGANLGLDGFLRTGIKLNVRRTGTYDLPPIRAMVSYVLESLERIRPRYSTFVLEDFQGDNILFNERDKNFKIVDISNARMHGDHALDIAKYFNLFDRFWIISEAKNRNTHLGKRTNVSLWKGALQFDLDLQQPPLPYEDCRRLEDEFVGDVALKTRDRTLPDRVKLYKFVVSLITIRRRVANDRGLAGNLFGVLIDSYRELREKI